MYVSLISLDRTRAGKDLKNAIRKARSDAKKLGDAVATTIHTMCKSTKKSICASCNGAPHCVACKGIRECVKKLVPRVIDGCNGMIKSEEIGESAKVAISYVGSCLLDATREIDIIIQLVNEKVSGQAVCTFVDVLNVLFGGLGDVLEEFFGRSAETLGILIFGLGNTVLNVDTLAAYTAMIGRYMSRLMQK